jgi:hypothetical protein
MGWEIKHNRLKCKKCGDIIESMSVHDFVWCKCGTIFVDGGHEYYRRGGDLEQIEDLCESVWVEDDENKIEKAQTLMRQPNLLVDCDFCASHYKGDTLYESADWDGGIGYDFIRDIKYCPICGKELQDD